MSQGITRSAFICEDWKVEFISPCVELQICFQKAFLVRFLSGELHMAGLGISWSHTQALSQWRARDLLS